jgi:hypothetical protein
MSNDEICLIIFNNINIKGICYKLRIHRDIDDIEQIVYDIVLHYDNLKLNDVYSNGALLSFVFRLIKNQRNIKDKTEWSMLQEYSRLPHNYEVEDEEFDSEKENKLNYIEKEFELKTPKEIVRMSLDEQDYYTDKLLLRYKIMKKWTLSKMSKDFGLSRNKINDCIQSVKKELRKRYD